MLDFASQKNNIYYIIDAHELLSNLYLKQHNFSQVTAHLDSARFYSIKLKDDNSVIYYDNNLGSQFLTLGEYSKALEKFMEAKEIGEKINEADCPCLYGEYQTTDGHRLMRQSVLIEQNALTPPGDPLGIRVGCCLADAEDDKQSPEFQSAWNGFLRLYNFFQFLPYSYFVTTNGLTEKAYDGLNLYEEPITGAGTQAPAADDSAWSEIKELTDEVFHALLARMEKHAWPVPEPGYELEGAGGEIVGSAELAWEELQLAFLTEEELVYEQGFTDAGWKIFTGILIPSP